MAETASIALLHSLVAAICVAFLLRFWHVDKPSVRLHLWLVVLLVPAFLTVVFPLIFPFRQGEAFQDDWALFAVSRWSSVRLWGLRVDLLGLAAAVVTGVVLYLRDLLPFLAEAMAPRSRAGVQELGAPLQAVARELAEGLGVSPPELVILAHRSPLLLCEGIRRPRLVLSAGTLATLDDAELRGAFAHELVHVSRRDPAFGWVLLLVRTLLVFDPVVQIVARAAAQEAEKLADEFAVRLTGDPLALASALVKLHREGEGDPATLPGWIGRSRTAGLLHRSRTAPLQRRLRRLLDGAPPARVGDGPLQVGLAAAGLAALLFLVT